MAHGIMAADQGSGAAFFAYNKPGWHNLGITQIADIDGGKRITAMEALDKIRGNFAIEKRPVMISINPENPMGTDSLMVVPDQYMLYRGPCALDSNPATFGLVGKDYEFFQNHEIAGLVDYLASETGWQLETIGCLWDGMTLFIALDAGECTVAGETVKRYFLYVSTRDGKSSDYILFTPVRAVCHNTVSLALDRNFGRVTVRHHTGMKSLTSYYVQVIADAQRAGEDVIAALQVLESIRMTDEAFAAMLDATFPLVPVPDVTLALNSGNDVLVKKAQSQLYSAERANKLNNRARELVTANYASLNLENPANANNGWNAIQAVAQYTTHQDGLDTDNGKRVRATRDLTGAGLDIRTRAYRSIVANAPDAAPVVQKGKRKGK